MNEAMRPIAYGPFSTANGVPNIPVSTDIQPYVLVHVDIHNIFT